MKLRIISTPKLSANRTEAYKSVEIKPPSAMQQWVLKFGCEGFTGFYSYVREIKAGSCMTKWRMVPRAKRDIWRRMKNQTRNGECNIALDRLMRAQKIKRRSEQMEKSLAISHFVGLSPAKKKHTQGENKEFWSFVKDRQLSSPASLINNDSLFGFVPPVWLPEDPESCHDVPFYKTVYCIFVHL